MGWFVFKLKLAHLLVLIRQYVICLLTSHLLRYDSVLNFVSTVAYAPASVQYSIPTELLAPLFLNDSVSHLCGALR